MYRWVPRLLEGGATEGGDGSGARFHCNTQALFGVFKVLIQFLQMGRPPRRACAGQVERAARPGLSAQRPDAQRLWAPMRGSRCPGLNSPLLPSPARLPPPTWSLEGHRLRASWQLTQELQVNCSPA